MAGQNVWYFGPADGQNMVTAHLAVVSKNYPNGNKDVGYTDLATQEFVGVSNVPHGTTEWQPNTYRTLPEAGEGITDGGMGSAR